MPKRKPGLWRHTITTAGATQTMTLCLDAAADRQLAVWGQGASQEMCQQTDMRRRLDGAIAFSSTCDMGGGGKTTSKGVIQGDFGTAYKMEADSVTEGASAPQMNGAHKMTLEAAWTGPCPAGARPGDVEMNGMKFNMVDMLAKK
jgi:hypothetical protein